jgi:3-hydroxyisobutyrate dehydrogenase-like beta-hydroxyacid dehydrogenase
VSTHLRRPSPASRDKGAETAITGLASLDAAIMTSDLVISLVPPGAATQMAEAVADAAQRCGACPLYLDANSVSPMTMTTVVATLAEAGLECVDGAFVGSAAELGGRTRLYLSGPRAGELAAVLPPPLHASNLGPEIGKASALKLAFAGFNKALVALFLDVMQAGGLAGEQDELLACLRTFYPGTVRTLERLLPSYPRHAARRADELDEMVHWLASQGYDPAWAMAARDVLRRVAALGLDETRDWTFAEVLVAGTAPLPIAELDSGGDADVKP